MTWTPPPSTSSSTTRSTPVRRPGPGATRMGPDWIVLGAAMLTGLLGGAHCAAMCGGIATGLSIQQRGGWWMALQPNLGRVLGYTAAGAVVGAFGHGLLDAARLPWLGIALRATVGAVLV